MKDTTQEQVLAVLEEVRSQLRAVNDLQPVGNPWSAENSAIVGAQIARLTDLQMLVGREHEHSKKPVTRETPGGRRGS